MPVAYRARQLRGLWLRTCTGPQAEKGFCGHPSSQPRSLHQAVTGRPAPTLLRARGLATLGTGGGWAEAGVEAQACCTRCWRGAPLRTMLGPGSGEVPLCPTDFTPWEQRTSHPQAKACFHGAPPGRQHPCVLWCVSVVLGMEPRPTGPVTPQLHCQHLTEEPLRSCPKSRSKELQNGEGELRPSQIISFSSFPSLNQEENGTREGSSLPEDTQPMGDGAGCDQPC